MTREVFLDGRNTCVTVSDACAREREDLSGQVLSDLLTECGVKVVDRKIVPDDLDSLADLLRQSAERSDESDSYDRRHRLGPRTTP